MAKHLAAFLIDSYFSDNPTAWDQVARVLLPTGRADEWKEAMREMTVLHLTHRLIKGGSTIAGGQGGLDAVAKNNIKILILNTMSVRPSAVNDIYARLEPAIRSTRQKINSSTRRVIEAEARKAMPYCYLCGTDLDFDSNEDYWTAFTIDHVWPRAYGGNSLADNLLPACQSCNVKKGHTPSWSMYPVQALIAGHQLDDEKLATLPKEMRFSVQSRAAAHHATANATSLKDAFISLGRPGTPSVVNPQVSVDVFNLDFETV